MNLLSAAQMRELDRLTIEERGIAGNVLMANAAAAVVRAIARDYPTALAGRIGILCGGGNNGGDGLVAARLLLERNAAVTVQVFAPLEKLNVDCVAALAGWQAAGGAEPAFIADANAWERQRSALLECDLLVDAIFGTGLLRPVGGWLRDVIADINHAYRGPVLAVDMPSGLGADGEGPAESPDAPVLRARHTVTFAAPKLGHLLSRHAAAVGKLEVAPIGIPQDLLDDCGCTTRMSTAADARALLGKRARDAHKGNFGHVLVIAGSVGKSGAAVLASRAALRAGAGLVTAAVPRSVLPTVAAALPELTTEPMPESRTGTFTLAGLEPKVFQNVLRAATVIALGPGLGSSPEAAGFARLLVSAIGVPCVLDADGLNAFAGKRDDLRFRAKGVLTPHPGEMARLFQVSNFVVQARRSYYAQRLAAETGAVVLLKGQATVIADPDGAVFVNPTGNPGMATAGSGDALTGVIAALLAQFPAAPLLRTVAVAVYLHGLAGDLAAERQSEMGMITSDLIESLPAALVQVRDPARD